jgi:sugar/nucleoside kinase (ribokinase family)
MGKVGGDLFGRATLDLLRNLSPELAAGMILDEAATSSYTVVINPPGQDRTFLHCTGANDSFVADDVDLDRLDGAKVFHFGYPTLMRSIYSDGGRQMEALFRNVRARGLLTSLDMSMPDPASEAGRVDWPAWLRRVLPFVDYYMPSLDETRMMLRSEDDAGTLSRQLRDWGAGVVGLKLGDQGLYVRWPDRELWAPCFRVEVAGTTGAGDCTIAGFLAGLVRGLSPERIMTLAVATGACCCEAADATSGVQAWDQVWRRIESGWDRLPLARPPVGWARDTQTGVHLRSA